jgi:hypothetical protein
VAHGSRPIFDFQGVLDSDRNQVFHYSEESGLRAYFQDGDLMVLVPVRDLPCGCSRGGGSTVLMIVLDVPVFRRG